ncbi:kinase-like domain-containing protein [Sparassis latifolia]
MTIQIMPSAMIGTICASIMVAIYYVYWWYHERKKLYELRCIRQKLPSDLDTWRVPGRTRDDEERIWETLDPIFRDRGLTLWPNSFGCTLKTPGTAYPTSSGFAYVTPNRSILKGIGSVYHLMCFDYTNPLTRMARTPDGHDVAVRVIVIKNEGHEHLKILRKIATTPRSLLSTNHTLPMIAEFGYEDIIFGIFPRVGSSMKEAFGYWAKNSVGDVMDMLLQALEALAFIHDMNIAHRDAFHDNFLVQWQPESMRSMTIPTCCPRVYLIDFEVAVEYPEECPLAERLTTGCPLGGSFLEPAMYSRPLAPEMTTNEPYCPFKLDVWQLGYSFTSVEFKTTITDIDTILHDMVHAQHTVRKSAGETLAILENVIHNIPPTSLLICPSIVE